MPSNAHWRAQPRKQKKTPRGWMRGFLQSAAGFRAKAANCFQLGMVDSKESNSAALRNMFSRQRCADLLGPEIPSEHMSAGCSQGSKEIACACEKTWRI
jgi:hypothetical protein